MGLIQIRASFALLGAKIEHNVQAALFHAVKAYNDQWLSTLHPQNKDVCPPQNKQTNKQKKTCAINFKSYEYLTFCRRSQISLILCTLKPHVLTMHMSSKVCAHFFSPLPLHMVLSGVVAWCSYIGHNFKRHELFPSFCSFRVVMGPVQ